MAVAQSALDPARALAARARRWNALCLLTDYVFFALGMAFVNATTVLPAFVDQLTDAPLLVGLVATVQTGGWLFPQLLAAAYVAGRPRVKALMVGPALLGRPAWWVLALVTALVGHTQPGLLLLAFFLGYALFVVVDGLVSVPWFEILGKAVPPTHRGRLLGTGQLLAGLLATGVGGLVGLILAHPALPFPTNYALLFFGAGACYLVSLGALALLREPPGPDLRRAAGRTPFWRALGPVLRTDRSFVRAVVVKLLVGAGTMVYPFYSLFALGPLGLAPEHLGLFLSAQVLGNTAGGLVLGPLADRHGPRRAIQMAAALGLLGPLLGLALLGTRGLDGPVVLSATGLIFALVGVGLSAHLLGFMNYVLEIAPPGQRSTYAGLFNTLGSTLLLVPPLAGWVLERTSFTVLFGLAALAFLAGLLASRHLPEPRGAGARLIPAAEAHDDLG